MFPKKKWLKGDAKAKNEVKASMSEDKLWKNFSLFIRLRDCPTDARGYARCITCGSVHHYKELQAGHYIRRRHRAVKYDERNVHAQCVDCNKYGNGKEAEHRAAIVEKYGEEVAVWLEEHKRDITKWSHAEVEALSTYYRVKAKEEAERISIKIK